MTPFYTSTKFNQNLFETSIYRVYRHTQTLPVASHFSGISPTEARVVPFFFIPSYLPTISPGYTALGSIWDLNPLVVFLHAGQKVELNHSPVRSAVDTEMVYNISNWQI